MNPLIQGHSGTALETSRFNTSRGMIEDDSQSDLHPEVGIFNNQTTQKSGPGDGHDMVTGVHQEVTNCSPTTSSGKQKKDHSINQPQFCSENNPATIEADQILLAFQQLADNNNSAKFHNNINRIFKLRKSLTTTMPASSGKSEKFELFDDLFQMSLKIYIQLTEEKGINYFHSILR